MITMRPIYFGGYRVGYHVGDWRSVPATILGEFEQFLREALGPNEIALQEAAIEGLEQEVRYLRQDVDEMRERAMSAEAKLTEIYKIVST